MNELDRKISILNNAFSRYHSQNTIKKGELIYKCPNNDCSSHLKQKDKFCINVYKESAHCWVCGLKIKNIAKEIKRVSYDSYLEWKSISKIKIYDDKDDDAEVKKVYYDEIVEKFTKHIFDLKSGHEARQYLFSPKRNLTLEDAVKFNIRFIDNFSINNRKIRNCICIPSHTIDGIDFLFFRSIENDFKYNIEASKTKIIFNDLFINWNKPIMLVEGVFDAIKSFDIIQSVPLLGSYLSEDSLLFSKILKHKPKVIICLDKEARKNQVKILSTLFRWGIDTYYIDLTGEKDLGGSTTDEIFEYSKFVQPYSINNNVLSKLYL